MTISLSFSHSHRVRFSEVNSHGHVFSYNYLVFFEIAMTEYCRYYSLLEHSLFNNKKPLLYTIRSSVEYITPVYFDQELKIYTGVFEIGTTSLIFRNQIFLQNEKELLAKGEVIWVNIDEKLRTKIPFTDMFRNKITTIEPQCIYKNNPKFYSQSKEK